MLPNPNLPAGSASRRSWLKKLGGVLGGSLLLGRKPAAAGVAAPQGQDAFLSEIMLVAFNFAPKGWALCNGQLLPINQNQALFSLLGTTYGGDGRVNFALPDLRGRVIVHNGAGFTLGQKGGANTHTLLASELPAHTHGLPASALGSTDLSGTPGPAGTTVFNALADSGGGVPQYGEATTINAELANSSTAVPPVNITGAVGGGQPHENRQPFLCLNYVISLQGIYPSQT